MEIYSIFKKDIVGKDEKINISEPRMYFGLETKRDNCNKYEKQKRI